MLPLVALYLFEVTLGENFSSGMLGNTIMTHFFIIENNLLRKHFKSTEIGIGHQTFSSELLTTFVEPNIGDGFFACKDRTSCMPRTVVTGSIPQKIIPKYCGI